MKSNVCVTLLNMLHKIYSKFTVYINELILTPFSPFDIKCKKINLMWKTSGNVFLGYLGERFFQISPRLHSIMGGVPNSFQNFRGCYNIQFKSYTPSKIKLFVTKNRKQLELLLTVATESFLNVTGLLIPLYNTQINLG